MEKTKGENQKEKRIFESEEYLIRESLVREMLEAERWQTIIFAWQALLKVKLMAKEMRIEDDILTSQSPNPKTQNK